MKKIIIAMMALAATAAAPAKTADELRIYINPGHGSWTPNDRPNPIVGHGEYSRTNTDTTNFFESNTNLRKGFGVLEKLREFGLKYDPTLNQEGDRHMIGAARDMSNNIVMSHVKCGPYHDDNGTAKQLGDATPADLEYYNRSLSEISAEVDANHFDMFISIHSNAATEGTSTNYPLFIYRGYDDCRQHEGLDVNTQNTSRAMATACWGHAFENPHMKWTYYSMSNMNIRGDVNFYGEGESSLNGRGYFGYLGVLKHGVPGFLVEGYFHTYQVARHRAMNWDVDYMEGAAYAHGIADYFGLAKEKTGDIYGIVRDANERFADKYYKPNTITNDRFLPLNGAVVILKKDGTEVARYTTDGYYNGAFVFKGVEPGDYTLEFEAEGYKAAEPVAVTVKAAEIAYPEASLVSENYVPPTVNYENYPDPLAQFSSIVPAPEYNTSAVYVDEPIAELEGMTVRRAIVREGKMYILALDRPIVEAAVVAEADQAKPVIIVYDLDTKTVLAKVSTAGAAGSVAAISDIQVSADGVLLACNTTKTQYDDSNIQAGDAGRGTFVIYKWANDENGLPAGDPAEWLSTTNSGLWFRAYPGHFAYSGTTTEGRAIITMPTVSDSRKLRATYIDVADGAQVIATDTHTSAGTCPILLSEAGDDVNIYTSPLNKDQFFMIDSKLGAQMWDMTDAFEQASEDVLNGEFAAAGRAGLFRYAGASFLVMPDNAEGTNNGIRLLNITGNLAGATASKVNIAGEFAPAEAAATAATGELRVTRSEFTGNIESYWLDFYLLRDNKITKITTREVQQPQGRREYAYDLASEDGEDAYTVSFKLTGDATDASIVITPEEGEAITMPLGALAAGDHSFTVNKSDLDMNIHYDWAVNVTSETITQPGLYSSDPSGLTVRGSVVPITDPEQASFGYVTVGHGANKGIDIYDPAGTKVHERLFVDNTILGGKTTNQSNPLRGDELNGNAVLATWGDSGYGMVVINPLDAAQEPYTLFAGEKQGSGNFVYNGVNLGGGTSGIAFASDGNDTYVITFSEDHEGKNGSGASENTLCRQHLGADWTITEAPESLGYKGMLANTNVDIVAYGGGVFVAQVRGAGNNQSSVPCFAYIADILTDDYDVTMNSADEGIVEYIDNNNSAVAITPDGKTLAAGLTGKIVVFDVAWDGNTPKLTYSYDIPTESNTWATMRFDAAGNLHTYLREGGYRVYTLPATDPVVSTPAASKYFFGAQSGIETITAADAADAADAVYYNLQGVRVAADCLAPGIYVRVSGAKASKVLVK